MTAVVDKGSGGSAYVPSQGEVSGKWFGNRWAGIKLVGEGGVATAKTAYYSAVYLGSRCVCSEEISKQYSILAINSCYTAFGRLGAAWFFGSKLVAPSVNQIDPNDLPTEKDFRDTLELINECVKNKPYMEGYIKNHWSDFTIGICHGRSLDLLSRVDDLRNLSPELIAKKTACYAQGAPSRAVCGQFFLEEAPKNLRARGYKSEVLEKVYHLDAYRSLTLKYSPTVYEELRNLLVEMPEGRYELALLHTTAFSHGMDIIKDDQGRVYFDDPDFGIALLGSTKEEMDPMINACKFYDFLTYIGSRCRVRGKFKIRAYLKAGESPTPELKAWIKRV